MRVHIHVCALLSGRTGDVNDVEVHTSSPYGSGPEGIMSRGVAQGLISGEKGLAAALVGPSASALVTIRGGSIADAFHGATPSVHCNGGNPLAQMGGALSLENPTSEQGRGTLREFENLARRAGKACCWRQRPSRPRTGSPEIARIAVSPVSFTPEAANHECQCMMVNLMRLGLCLEHLGAHSNTSELETGEPSRPACSSVCALNFYNLIAKCITMMSAMTELVLPCLRIESQRKW